jgi:hypothetical protein
MCLIIKLGQEPKIAKRNISVFKVLINYDSFYNTPYEHFPVKPGLKMNSIIVVNNGEIHIAIHSFATLEGAKKCVGYGIERQLFKCIIPKGAVYYIGTFYNKNDAYASDMLNYPEVLTPIN